MNNELPRQDDTDIPDAVAEPKRRFSIQLVWLVPILAAIIGVTLAGRALLERGPTITITFKTGIGLEAGKTKIKYKEVEIGEVKKVAISEDRSRVIVTARMGRDSKGLLVEDTRFWVVRPRLQGGYVSGLGTLLEGAYIGVDVGKATKPSRAFIGLEEPPPVTKDVPGTTFFLHAADLGSLNITSPIFFRRLQVGQVVAYDLDRDGKGVTFTIFINSPYDRYVRANTLFWHASGIDLSLSAGGLKVKTESVVAILLGGVAFQTPEDKGEVPRAVPNTAFSLFANREDAMKHAETSRTFLLVFRESVRGLSVNSPVEFRGVPLGEVSNIKLKFDERVKDFSIEVEIRIFPQRLRGANTSGPRPPENSQTFINDLVVHGLRARLGSGNLLTGQRYVSLDLVPNSSKAKVDWSRTPPRLPTAQAGGEDIQASLARISRKIEKMPLEEIAAEVRHAVRSLDQALQSADRLLKRTDAEIVPEARALLEEARTTLSGAREVLSTDAPLQQDLRETLRELSRAARSVRILVDYLELNPESLLRGKKGGGQ
ncbi:MCE family protein [bacterium]|nr:MCE family protein [bacterium]